MNINNEVIKLYQSKKYFIKLKRKKTKKKKLLESNCFGS